MPYKSIAEAKEGNFPITLDDVNLSIDQVNKLAEIYDALKADGEIEEPMPIAITQFKKMFKIEQDKWIKKEEQIEKKDMAETFSFEKNILSVGTWNNTKFTSQDLDEIVNNYNELGGYRNVPCKLGHNNDQQMLQKDGLPASGWVTKLKRVGNTLVAKIDNVPRKIKELIENKAYRDVSVELLKNAKEEGKIYKWILTAVSFLGMDIPAVKGLGDFVALYGEVDNNNIVKILFKEVIEENTSEISNALTKDKIIEEEIMDEIKFKEELEAKNAEVLKLAEEKREAEERISALEAEKLELTEEKRESEIKEFIDSYCKEDNMKILPAQKEMFCELLKSFSSEKVVNLSEESFSQKDMVAKILDLMPQQVDFSEISKNVEPEKKQTFEHESDKLDNDIIKLMEDKKISYKDAYEIAISKQEDK